MWIEFVLYLCAQGCIPYVAVFHKHPTNMQQNTQTQYAFMEYTNVWNGTVGADMGISGSYQCSRYFVFVKSLLAMQGNNNQIFQLCPVLHCLFHPFFVACIQIVPLLRGAVLYPSLCWTELTVLLYFGPGVIGQDRRVDVYLIQICSYLSLRLPCYPWVL